MATVPAKGGVKTGAKAPPSATAAPKPAIKPPSFKIEGVQRRERYLKALLYGNYGVGKTTLACSALEVASMRDVLMLNAESGDLSVDHMTGLDAVGVTNFKMLGQIYEFLKQHCKARDEGNIQRLKELQAATMDIPIEDIADEDVRQYRTVIVDSVSEIDAYCLNQLTGVTDSTKLDEDPNAAEWTEYKKNLTMMLRLVRMMRDLPMHVIFTAGEKYSQDETKKMKYTPDLTGQLAKKIQGFMDMVGYYVQGAGAEGQVARKLYVTPSPQGRYDAKHRYAQFKGDHFMNPSIGKILTQVGLLDKDGAPLKA